VRAIPFELRFAAYGGRMPTDIVQQADRAAETRSMIGEDLIIAGNVTSNGDLHVDGHIQRDVRCGSLVLGEPSQIEGNVVADEVVIRGRLIGSVRGYG
jgi:cytoskeletal protein CcmA (bactofilin family)